MRRVTRSIFALLIVCAACSQSPTQPIKAVAAVEPFPVPVIDLRGSSSDIGAEHGQELGDPIRNLFDAYFGKYFQSDFQRNMALMAATAFTPHVSAAHQEEIHALATSVEIDERKVLLGQCFLDLSAMTACSTITLPASAAPDHVARFGRNLDFPGFNVADKRTVLLIFHPKDRYAFASIAWPGMIGVLSGMNEHGLTLANMEVDRGRRLPVAMPYTLLYRTILEQCRTVDEAIALLKKTPRQTANNLMLMDASGDRAVVEITPETVAVRRAPDSAALISTNHHRGANLDAAGRCSRYDLMRNTSAKQFGRVGLKQVESMLAAVAQGKMTLQSMVFEPSNRVIYLAVGANAPTTKYHRLDLKEHF